MTWATKGHGGHCVCVWVLEETEIIIQKSVVVDEPKPKHLESNDVMIEC